MKLLADENVPAASIALWRQHNLDVIAIIESMAGVSDDVVLAFANNEARVVLTFDRDYGDLVYVRHLAAPNGIVLFRNDSFSRQMRIITWNLVDRLSSSEFLQN